MGNNFKFFVIATNLAGQSLASAESDFIIAATIPSKPTNIVRIAGDRTYITFGWQAPS